MSGDAEMSAFLSHRVFCKSVNLISWSDVIFNFDYSEGMGNCWSVLCAENSKLFMNCGDIGPINF